MDKNKAKTQRINRRKRGIRKQVLGTPQRPRLSVYRSLKHVYAQIVDDLAETTLVSANSRQLGVSGGNCSDASTVGKTLAEKAAAAGISEVAFDRNGRKYHGRIKALAEAARENGLKF
jgi:large subunit ribosomal protein L18